MSPAPFAENETHGKVHPDEKPKSVDPYALLGLDVGACDAWIQSAFRKASLHVHPDRCPDDPDAARKFHELTAAKDLLLDPQRRRVYDHNHRAKPLKSPEAWWSEWDVLLAELEAEEMCLDRLSGRTFSGLEDYVPTAVALPRGLPSPESPTADVLVVGATGVTGMLATALLRKGALAGRSWVIAGRDNRKLRLLEAKLGGGPAFKGAVLVNTPEDLTRAVRSSRVVVDLSGPAHRVGLRVAETCARQGRHYVHSTCEVTYSKLVREKLHTQAKANGACLVMHAGTNSLVHDFMVWVMVRCLRERYNLPTRRIDTYSFVDGCLLSGSCFESMSQGPNAAGFVPAGTEHPFLLGGVRGTGIRDEDKDSKEQPVESKPLQVHCLQGPLTDRQVVRATCGLMDSVQPYGRRFSYNNWLPYKDRETAQEMMLQSLIALKKLQPLVKEKKLPAPGTGPSQSWRRRSNGSMVSVATSESTGKEAPKVIHSLARLEPGLCLSDRHEGTALMCLDTACTLLDAIDAGQGKLLRSGWGTPVYHLAHLGFARRLVERGMIVKVGEGDLPLELLHNTMDSTLTLEL